jgi:hypothetical protein
MKYLTLIVSLVGLIPPARADDKNFCYSGGATFKRTYEALIEARDHCNFWHGHWFSGRREELSCHKDRAGQKIILSIWRPTDSGAMVDGEICRIAMEKIAETCSRGGQSYHEGWGYR